MQMMSIKSLCRSVLCVSVACGFWPSMARGESMEAPADWVELHARNTWCGAKCLVLVSQGLGRKCTLQEVLALCPPEKSDGRLSLADLAQVGRSLNYDTQSLKCGPSWLDHPQLPAIALLDLGDPKLSHFVLLAAARPDKIEFVDPFYPATLKSMDRDEFLSKWTGYVLVVSSSSGRSLIPDWLISAVLTFDVFVAIMVALLVARLLLLRRWAAAAGSILLVMSFFGCAESELAAAPQKTLEFAHTFCDNGVIVASQDTGTVKHSFPFVNSSNKPVRIGGVATSCSCSVSTYPEEPIPPGGEGEISLTSNLSGREGVFDARAVVVIAEPHEQQVTLVLRQFVTPAAVISPERLDFGETQIDTPARQTAKLRIYLGPSEPLPKVRLENRSGAVSAALLEPGELTTETLEHRGHGRVRAYDVSLDVALDTDCIAGTELSDILIV